jgi:hypothetical protein
VKQKATKEAANHKSLKKAAPSATKKVIAKPLAKKPRARLVAALTDDGVTL